MRHFRIRHETVYRYAGDVAHAHQLLHLAPRPSPGQRVLGHAIELRPSPACRREEVDVFGNPVTRVELDRPHRQLEVVAESNVQVRTRETVPADDTERWELVRDGLAYRPAPMDAARLDAIRFRMQSPFVRLKRAFAEYARDSFPDGRAVLEGAEALTTRIHEEFRYAPGETTVATPLLQILEDRRGVCQDFSHLMIACLRSLGLAARYVSGYLKTERREGAALGADASHAWVSVHCPPHGWIDLDPTNGTRVDASHVTLAWARDFGDISPLRGVLVGGGEHTVSVSVTTAELAG